MMRESRDGVHGGSQAADRPSETLVTPDQPCNILHIDMDAFYAAVEVRDDPSLRGKQVIVGHGAGRGVVLSATYEARAYGVRSAMPVAAAKRLAPNAIVVPPRHESYAQASRELMAIFRDVTPMVEPISLDEAFLDVTGAHRIFGSSEQIATHIRQRVASELSLTCSVGIAPNKFIAKLASGACKPDGVLTVPANRMLTFLHPLPIERVWGIGRKTADALHNIGVDTVGDLASVPVSTLEKLLGQSHGAALAELAWARDNRGVHVDEPDKSVGAEVTFDYDRSDLDEVRAEMLRLSMKVARRLRAGEHVCRTVGIKVKFEDFTSLTRSRSLPESTDLGRDIYDTALGLFNGLNLQRVRIRLIGVRTEGLRPAREQVLESLFADEDEAWSAMERTADAAAAKFGSEALKPARLLSPPTRAATRAASPAASRDATTAGGGEVTGAAKPTTIGPTGEPPVGGSQQHGDQE